METAIRVPRIHLRSMKWPAPGMSQPAMKTIGGKDEDWALAGTDAFVAISLLMITG
jgi:hypothetical protein